MKRSTLEGVFIALIVVIICGIIFIPMATAFRRSDEKSRKIHEDELESVREVREVFEYKWVTLAKDSHNYSTRGLKLKDGSAVIYYRNGVVHIPSSAVGW